jgi:uncharacterized damage-inducible protein DinB
MKIRMFFAPVVFLAAAAFSQTVPQKPAPTMPAQAPPPTVSSELDRALLRVETQFVAAAEAMPEDKFGFAPTQGEFKGVRTFAEQLKHVASTNYAFFSAILGEAPPARDSAENGPAGLKSKVEILKYLRDSFALGHRAMAAITDQNAVEPIKNPMGHGTATRLGLTTMVIGHCFDHYGQMVEYLRMNGIVPPASRK